VTSLFSDHLQAVDSIRDLRSVVAEQAAELRSATPDSGAAYTVSGAQLVRLAETIGERREQYGDHIPGHVEDYREAVTVLDKVSRVVRLVVTDPYSSPFSTDLVTVLAADRADAGLLTVLDGPHSVTTVSGESVTVESVDASALVEEALTVFDEAGAVVTGPRQSTYGHPLDNLTRVALLWTTLLSTAVTPEQVCWLMAAMKSARQMNKPHRDNLVDAIGYIGLIEEMERELVRRGYASMEAWMEAISTGQVARP
jgi:Domain of unknown function (DUF6378)